MEVRPGELCELDGPQLARTLRQLAELHGAKSLTVGLLQALGRDSVPASVTGSWLSCCQDAECTVSFLSSSCRYTRTDTLLAVKRWLRGSRWREMWEALGGVKGLLELLARLCLDDVKLLIVALRKSVRAGQTSSNERRQLLTELTQCLFSQLYPNASFPNPDGRQLQDIYTRLLPACTSDFVLENVGGGLAETQWSSSIFFDRLIPIHHGTAIQAAIITGINEDNTFNMNIRKFCKQLLQKAPTVPKSKAVWSESMNFTWDLLNAIHVSPVKVTGWISIMNDLVMPLLRRLSKHRHRILDRLQVVNLTLAHVRSDLGIVRDFSGFRTFVVALWARNPKIYDEALREMLHLIGSISPCVHYQADIMNAAPKKLRYRLLKLIWLHALERKVDLTNDHELSQHVAEVQSWQCGLFLCLEPEDGLDLLDRLQRASGREPSVTDNFNSLPRNPPLTAAQGLRDLPDVEFLRLKLMQPSAETTEFARKHIEELKLEAARGRTPEARRDYASLVALYSVQSRELKVYHACLEWSKRFMRDPLASSTLFSQPKGSFFENAAPLLNGINDYQAGTTVQLRSNVTLANDTLRLWLQIVCEILRQPTLSQSDKGKSWSRLGDLLDHVASLRVFGAGEVKRRLGLNSDELYSIVYAPTLAVLLEVEEVNLCLDNEDGKFGMSRSEKRDWFANRQTVDQATWTFIDEYAKYTDALWAKKRREWNPEITSMPPIFPQGLTLQLALPFDPTEELLAGASLPYVEGRAQNIVFTSAQDACVEMPKGLGQDEPYDETSSEDDDPVNFFVDQYKLAVKIYVFTANQGDTVQSRIENAWNHAVTELSKDLDSPRWIEARWREAFSETFGTLFDRLSLSIPLLKSGQEKDQSRDQWPVCLPEDDGLSYWNPAAKKPEPIKSIRRNATVIDTLLSIEYRGWWYPRRFAVSFRGFRPEPRLPGYKPAGIFMSSRLNAPLRKSAKNVEGLIAAAVLWLDLRKGDSKGVLTDGHPVTSDSRQHRFPHLVLDPDFGLSDEPSIEEAIELLSRYQHRLPNALLVTLAKDAFHLLKTKKMDTSENVRVEKIFFLILNLIVGTPPATQLVSDAVVELPKSSSWHRHIFNRRLLNRLNPAQCLELMQRFNSRVIEVNRRRKKTEPSKQVPVAIDAGPEGEPKYVKVTSVKIVANLLSDKQLFSVPTAAKILSDILANNSHPDIRTTAIDALCSMMVAADPANTSEKTVKQIEDVLYTLKPTLAALDERAGSIDPWVGWDTSRDMPEISIERPALFYSLLFRAPNSDVTFGSSTETLPQHWQEFIADSLLFPAAEDNIANHALWLSRFQQKHASTGTVRSYNGPILTTYPNMLYDLLKQMPRRAPAKFFQLAHSAAMAEVETSSSTEKGKGLRDGDTPNAKPKELTSWRAATAPSGRLLLILACMQKLLHATTWVSDSNLKNQVTLSAVQDGAISLAKAIILRPDSKLATWSQCVTHLRPTENCPQYVRSTEIVQCAPVIRALIPFIESLRTPAWQASPSRQPSQLPDTFILRSWLWRAPPNTSYDEDNDDANLDPLVEDLMTDLRAALALPGRVLFKHEHQVVKATLEYTWGQKRQKRLASMLGDMEVWRPMSEVEKVLRVQLVSARLKDIESRYKGADREWWAQTGRMVERWIREESEEVREMAWEVKAWLKEMAEVGGVRR